MHYNKNSQHLLYLGIELLALCYKTNIIKMGYSAVREEEERGSMRTLVEGIGNFGGGEVQELHQDHKHQYYYKHFILTQKQEKKNLSFDHFKASCNLPRRPFLIYTDTLSSYKNITVMPENKDEQDTVWNSQTNE